MKRDHKTSLRHAVRNKVVALKSEATKLAEQILGEEKNICRLQALQSETVGRLARCAARKVEIQRRIELLRDEICKEEDRCYLGGQT